MIILFRYRMYLNKCHDSWAHIFCAMPFYAFRLYLIKSSMPHRESLSLWWKIKDKNDRPEPHWRGGTEPDGRSRAWKCHTRTKVGRLTRFVCLFRLVCLCQFRVILILKILFLQLLHGFKLFHLVSDFQNSFCFWCTTLPSAVRKIFPLQWEFQWENGQNQ